MSNDPTRIAAGRNAFFIFLPFVCLVAAGCAAGPRSSPTMDNTPTAQGLAAARTPIQILPTATSVPVPSVEPTRAPLVCSPLAVQPLNKIKEIVTQPFSMPRILENGTYTDDAHHGVDLGYYTRGGQLFTGTPVVAALRGKIAAVVHNRPPYGNMLMLETPFADLPAYIIASQHIPSGDSLYTLYAHLQNLQPWLPGEAVDCGQQLAETGLTGFTGGPHLHFETRWGPPGVVFDGMGYYRADMTPAELKNYELWRMSGTFHLFDPLLLLAP